MCCQGYLEFREWLTLEENGDPRITEVKDWDIPDGDAQHMKGVPNNTYNFLNSSHCFEHLVDPRVSLRNWIRIVKPGGYLLITIPDEDMYEQGNWPSKFNGHHKTSFTIAKKKSWSRASVNVLDLLSEVSNLVEVIKVEKVDDLYDYSKKGPDQTLDQCVECAIEIVLRKR